MYRRPRSLEVIIAIREEMARAADFDVDLFVEMARSGKGFDRSELHAIAENNDRIPKQRPKKQNRSRKK